MSAIMLKDILISARQEAFRMRHFYLGVEHLFIALLGIRGGLASGLMEEQGLATEYVIDALRRKVGKGSRHRLWAGIPNTPRTEVILGIANELALAENRKEINERDLLLAILEEADNMAVRVLRALNQNIDELRRQAKNRVLNSQPQDSFIKISFGAHFDKNETLSDDQLFVLRRMFHEYEQVRVERRLTGGYTRAVILVVTPINADKTEHASVVVKIDQSDRILDEAQRYESHVKNTLPPLTARLEDRPTAPETSDFAGLKYTLVGVADQHAQDLHQVTAAEGAAKLGEWLRSELYPTFGRNWWNQRRPYRFQVYREYDWLLPPMLTLEYVEEKEQSPTTPVLKMPLKLQRLKMLEYGDLVAVENFTVQRVYRERNAIQLAVGSGTEAAYKIEVRGIDLQKDAFYRGEVVERITGRIYKTRAEQLMYAARALSADFDLKAELISIDADFPRLPNPLQMYEDLLERHINGSMSKIHGDLHLGNVLVGPRGTPSLVDFAQARDGHTVFDWATLEISILCDIVMQTVGDSWDHARSVVRTLHALNDDRTIPQDNPPLTQALAAVTAIREIVKDLITAGDWSEYYMALTMCALRAMTWETMHIPGRRLMFLVAALSIYHFQPVSGTETPSPEEHETDIADNSASPSP
jgi:hypothetical protein